MKPQQCASFLLLPQFPNLPPFTTTFVSRWLCVKPIKLQPCMPTRVFFFGQNMPTHVALLVQAFRVACCHPSTTIRQSSTAATFFPLPLLLRSSTFLCMLLHCTLLFVVVAATCSTTICNRRSREHERRGRGKGVAVVGSHSTRVVGCCESLVVVKGHAVDGGVSDGGGFGDNDVLNEEDKKYEYWRFRTPDSEKHNLIQ